MSRREDAVRQSGDRRLSDADDRGVPAAAAEGLLQARPIDRRTRRSTASSKDAAAPASDRATFTWGPRDIFVVPSWQPVSHEASEEAVLFSASDRAAQKALGLWREENNISG